MRLFLAISLFIAAMIAAVLPDPGFADPPNSANARPGSLQEHTIIRRSYSGDLGDFPRNMTERDVQRHRQNQLDRPGGATGLGDAIEDLDRTLGRRDQALSRTAGRIGGGITDYVRNFGRPAIGLSGRILTHTGVYQPSNPFGSSSPFGN